MALFLHDNTKKRQRNTQIPHNAVYSQHCWCIFFGLNFVNIQKHAILFIYIQIKFIVQTDIITRRDHITIVQWVRYGLDDRGTVVQFPAAARVVSLVQRVQPSVSAWSEAECSLPSSAEVTNEWSCTSIPRTVYTERCSALQAARPSHDGLWVPSLEVRRPFPCQEAAGDSLQGSSRCYWCTLVHQ